MLWFVLLLLSSSFFFSSPNLSRRRMDVCHTSTHGVALVRLFNLFISINKNSKQKIWTYNFRFVSFHLTYYSFKRKLCTNRLNGCFRLNARIPVHMQFSESRLKLCSHRIRRRNATQSKATHEQSDVRHRAAPCVDSCVLQTYANVC